MEKSEMKKLSSEDFCRAIINPQQFSPSDKGQVKKVGLKIDNEVFGDILARALAVSPECKIKIIDLATDGLSENDLLRAIVDIANGKKIAPTQKAGGETINSFAGIKDEDFFAGLSHPSLAF